MNLDNEDKKVEIEVLLFECGKRISTCKHIRDRQNGPETKNHFVGRPYIHTLPLHTYSDALKQVTEE